MSNYDLTPKDKNWSVKTGWDNMLDTLFLTVLDESKDEDDPDHDVLWFPGSGHFCHDLDELRKQIERYVDMSNDNLNSLMRKLRADMD